MREPAWAPGLEQEPELASARGQGQGQGQGQASVQEQVPELVPAERG